jgi:hypothetical protein
LASAAAAQQQRAAVERRPQPVDWEAARAARAAAEARIGHAPFKATADAYAAELDATRLPVLVPAASATAGKLVSQGDSYTFLHAADGADVSVFGTRFAAEVADPTPELARMVGGASDDLQVDLTEEGVDVSLERFGASYVIRVSCDDPDEPRCAGEGFGRELAASLVMIGGSPQP